MGEKLLFVYYQNSKPGGVAKVLANLSNQLVEEGYDVEILFLVSEHKDFYAINPKIKKHYLDSFGHRYAKMGVMVHKKYSRLPKSYNIYSYLYDAAIWDILKDWIRENHQRYDLIISCWYKLSSILATEKTIAEKTIAWEHMSYLSGGLFWNKMMRPYYKNLKAVISTNKPGEKHYKTINPNSVTIYNPMDQEVESQPYIPPHQKQNVISLVARMAKEKNVTAFLDIIAEAKLPDDWKVIIIGGGPEEDLIKRSISEKNLESIVEMRGNQPMDAVYQLLSISKINCLTSTVEALPTILIQAMFFSNSLVAYDCTFGPSDIINEKNGYLAPLHDRQKFIQSLQSLVGNPEMLDNVMKAARHEADGWKSTEIVSQWKKLLS